MSVLLDTSVIVDVLRKEPGAVVYLDSLRDAPSCSEITRIELLQGIRKEQVVKLDALFREIRWHGVDEPIARRAGQFGLTYYRSHRLGIADLIIAATAVELDLELATRNVKHFPMFEDLRSPYSIRGQSAT